jgi:hypothetical protein
MDMVRHDHVTTDNSILSLLQGIAQRMMRLGIREYRFSAFRANRQEYNDRGIEPFMHRLMNGVLTP